MPGKIIVYKALQDDGTSYWEDAFPVEVLQKWENEHGPVSFASQYQSSPIDTAGSYLKRAWLHFYDYRERPTEFDRVVMFIDPATSQKKTADFFSLSVGGRTGNKVYLFDLLRTRAPLGQQLEYIKDKYAIWTPDDIVIEAGGQQGYFVDYVKENTMFNVIVPDRKWHQSDKKTKFEGAAAHFNASRALLPGFKDTEGNWHPIQEFEVFIDEWTAFPLGLHDDTLDSVSGVIYILISGISAAGVEEPGGIEDAKDFIARLATKVYDRELNDEEKAILEQYYAGDGVGTVRNLGFFRGMNI